jgi:hypothetical protein
MDKFVYIVFMDVNNGVDTWSHVHSVWLSKEQADAVELNLSLNNSEPERVEYSVQEIEIGVVIL